MRRPVSAGDGERQSWPQAHNPPQATGAGESLLLGMLAAALDLGSIAVALPDEVRGRLGRCLEDSRQNRSAALFWRADYRSRQFPILIFGAILTRLGDEVLGLVVAGLPF